MKLISKEIIQTEKLCNNDNLQRLQEKELNTITQN